MATPTKGGVFRTFASAVVDRIAGRSAGTSQSATTALVPSTGATEAEQQAGFSPGVQYFPSGMPMRPVAPAGSTTGRQFDFPAFINQNYTPRGEQGEGGIGFVTLRRMASPADGGLDLLRLAIETRKDQMVAQRWTLRGRAKNDDGGARARKIEQWWRKPDGVHTYRVWLRMLLEDHFVLDAPVIYYAEGVSQGAKRPLLEIVDGTTIKKYITGDDGRTPLPPLPAYAQILKGTPAADYTLDELGYYAYNLLPYRLYGMSRVEQVIAHVNMAIQRGMSQLDYFTEGTTPDGFIEVPKEWTVEQIQQYAEWFNSILAGQTGERRRLQFVPSGANYKPTKDAILKDVFDEWLARIICFCFSLPPQALVKETNRATAQTNKEAAQEEGLEPTKLWLKDVMDDALDRVGAGELEWQWQDEEIVDPEAKARVAQTYFGGSTGTASKIITLAEAREFIGFPPASAAQLLELQPPEPEPDPAVSGQSADAVQEGANKSGSSKKNGDEPQANKKDEVTKAAKTRGGRLLPQLERNVRLAERTRTAVESLTAKVLTKQRTSIAAAFADHSEKFAKASDDELATLIKQILADAWDDDAREKLWNLLATLSADRAAAAMEQLETYLVSGDYKAALTQANEHAVEWARFRSTNLITEVNDTTRQVVNELTAAAIEDGSTNRQLASTLSDAFEFSRERADMIARTETAFADVAGTLEGYRASGVVDGKQWSADPDACDECAALDGVVVALDEEFPDDGGDGPPLHPNCLCGVVAVLTADAEELIVDE